MQTTIPMSTTSNPRKNGSGSAGSSSQNGSSPTRGVARRPSPKKDSIGNKDSEYVDTVTEAEKIDPKWEAHLETEFSKDYPLSNFPSGHADRAELLLMNRMDMLRKSHPPQQSALQGDVREELIGDSKKALDANDLFQLQSYLRRILSRVRRGEGGWQQNKFDGVLSVSKTESGSSRSLKEKIFG